MSLAQALFRRVEYREPDVKPAKKRAPVSVAKKSPRGIGGPSGVPIRLIQQAGIVYILSRFTSPRWSWKDVTDWVCEEAGTSITQESVRERVKHFASGRCHFGSELHAELARCYIVLRLHGVKQPWPVIAQQLRETRGIDRDHRRLNLYVIGWMHRYMGRKHDRD